MTYKLFIDDLRDPVTTDWIIARSSTEAEDIVIHFGIPNEIAFDHDLGGDDTSMVFIHWLSHLMIDFGLIFPKHFKYSVHSMNPIGSQNIRGTMDNLVKNFI